MSYLLTFSLLTPPPPPLPPPPPPPPPPPLCFPRPTFPLGCHLVVSLADGRQKLAQVLIRKGANPNHQNAGGNTAMHYAMAYKFHDLASWLASPDGGGASDAIMNNDGRGPYDGLE